MNLLKVAIHTINFWTSWRLSGGCILVIVDTFGLGSIPHRETICPSNFPEGTPNVHFSGFSIILNFLRLSKVSARSEMSPSSSQVLTTTSSTYASTLHPSCKYRNCCIPPLISCTHTFKSEWNSYTPSNNKENLERCNRSWGSRLDRSGVTRRDLFYMHIKISIIDTHPPFFILFWYKNGIGKPIQAAHFFNKTGI
jgi:hypothetical protein